jgi:hypothetical protein
MKIEDGKGKNGDMSVSASQRGNVSSKTNPRIFYISRDDQQAYNAIMDSAYSATAGDYVFYYKNTSTTRNCFIRQMEFHSVQSVKWRIWEVTGTAAAGTTITPSNLNLSSGLAAEAICMGGGATITGLTTVKQVGIHRSLSGSESAMNFEDALILGPGKAIAIEYDTGTTGICETDMFFHYEDLGFS